MNKSYKTELRNRIEIIQTCSVPVPKFSSYLVHNFLNQFNLVRFGFDNSKPNNRTGLCPPLRRSLFPTSDKYK